MEKEIPDFGGNWGGDVKVWYEGMTWYYWYFLELKICECWKMENISYFLFFLCFSINFPQSTNNSHRLRGEEEVDVYNVWWYMKASRTTIKGKISQISFSGVRVAAFPCDHREREKLSHCHTGSSAGITRVTFHFSVRLLLSSPFVLTLTTLVHFLLPCNPSNILVVKSSAWSRILEWHGMKVIHVHSVNYIQYDKRARDTRTSKWKYPMHNKAKKEQKKSVLLSIGVASRCGGGSPCCLASFWGWV